MAHDNYPLHHLPYGVFSRAGESARTAVRLHDQVVDLAAIARSGALDGIFADAGAVLDVSTLNVLLAEGPERWSKLRGRLRELLSRADLRVSESTRQWFFDADDVDMHLPVAAPHYVDFYSSLYHAENAGRILRPQAPALPPNWLSMPIGYHGHPGNLVVSGTPVVRPSGHMKDEAGAETYRPTRLLDFELEVAFIAGPDSTRGVPLTAESAREHIFGIVLMNDWSARDVQRFENPPLGPLISKSFSTSLGAWVTPLEALEHVQTAAPRQDPQPIAYLHRGSSTAFDIRLQAHLVRAGVSYPLTDSNLRHVYWTMEQQLAYFTAGGARVQTGDVFGSGTVSGPTPESRASLLELTEDGRRPLHLGGDVEVGYLLDGDEIVLSATVGGSGHLQSFELAPVSGRITAAA